MFQLFLLPLNLAHFSKLFQYWDALSDINFALSLIPDTFTGRPKKFVALRMRAIIKFYLMRYRDGMNDLQMALKLPLHEQSLSILMEEWDMMQSRLNNGGYALEDGYRQAGTYRLDSTIGLNVLLSFESILGIITYHPTKLPPSKIHEAIIYGLQPRRFYGPRIDWLGQIGYQH
jgi:hypothetical protein